MHGVAGISDPVVVEPGAEQHETHGSIVRLAGDKAYKLRKPVRFAFLDQSSPEARERLAYEEVRVNQELAPGTYLGVHAVEIDPDGAWRVAPAGADVPADGEVVVAMRRFAEDDTLASRVAAGRVDHADLHRLGALLARFHAHTPSVGGGGVRAALARVHRNLEDLVELDTAVLDQAHAWSLARPLTAFALHHAGDLEARAARGCWRDGHGDLRADHVILDEHRVQVVDRLEFDPGLRADDVASDLAFLLMDLHLRGARWAAAEVLTGYRTAGGDAGDDRLLAFWMAYRASVSAKVALLRAEQLGTDVAVAGAACRAGFARQLAWRTRTPRVLVLCGPPACGKSTLAAELHRRSGLPVLSSDVIRKRHWHLAPTDRAPDEAYSAAASLAVHEELGRRAAGVLPFHGGVVVDATMGSPLLRAAFAEALGASDAPVTFVECRVPENVLDARARAREHELTAVSDATAAVAARLRAAWAPLDEVAPDGHLLVRADREVGVVADEIERHLDGVRV